MPSERNRRRLLIGTPLLFLLLWVTVGDHLLTHWAYALERGRIQASDQELAELEQQFAELNAISRAFNLVAKVARPGVVSIDVSGGTPQSRSPDERGQLREHLRDMIPEDQLDRWIDRFEPPPALGSGFILDSEGYILTNNHVVENRERIRVTLYDDRTYDANIVGTDPKTDLAMVKIDAPDLHPLRFGSSDDLQVGDWVIAVGAPFGLSQTVTHGIVSATGRSDLDIDVNYKDFIQTDAAINPGNSGGPLLNLRGEVVGVNTAIATHGTGSAGVGFAIPSALATSVARQLRSSGTVRRGWLGVVPGELNPIDADILGLASRDGTIVVAILNDSPADQAGLMVEDVITHVDGVRVRNTEHFRSLVADLPPQKLAKFAVVRDAHGREINVRIGLQPDDVRARANQLRSGRIIDPLGLEVVTFRPRLAGAYSDDERGVFVLSVTPQSSERPEISPGELIVSCNGNDVARVADLLAALRSSPVGSRVRLQIREPTGDSRTVTIRRQPGD